MLSQTVSATELRIRKTTISTTLAKAEHKEIKDIPVEFQKYKKVFSDEEAQRLLKH